MKVIFILATMFVASISLAASSPSNVECMKSAKAQGKSMLEAYQECSVKSGQNIKKQK